MVQSSDIPQPSKEQVNEWVKNIIIKYNLQERLSIENIILSISYYFSEQFDNYRIEAFDFDNIENCFRISSKTKVDGEDNIIDWMLPKEDNSEEANRLKEYLKATYRAILARLNIIDPANYSNFLTNMNINSFEKIPDYKDSVFNFWAEKIIKHFNIVESTTLDDILKKTIQFFNMLFVNYEIIYAINKKDVRKYPVYIDRKNGNFLMWFNEIDKIRKIIFSTHYKILKKLNRIKDYPKDPEFWFDLVIVYDQLGMFDEADNFGDMGLALNPKELGGLTELVTYYNEKGRYLVGLKYVKYSGHLIKEQKNYQLALNIFTKVVNVEPKVKENWVILADLYSKMGNEIEAKNCRNRAAQLK
ncbi:MAG: hypothetical protein JXA54_11030 [Candidatus Heimdallarchaeota archaeon]|nr:hypothetical protein [Candidatus Heimdallarchaeota archaeon]